MPCALPAQLLAGIGKLLLHTCNPELSNHVTAVTAYHSGHMTRMPACQDLETLKGLEGGGRNMLLDTEIVQTHKLITKITPI